MILLKLDSKITARVVSNKINIDMINCCLSTPLPQSGLVQQVRPGDAYGVPDASVRCPVICHFVSNCPLMLMR